MGLSGDDTLVTLDVDENDNTNPETTMMTATTLQDAWAMWKAGEAHELSNVLGDMTDGLDTFFSWDEESHDYPLPVFVFGDRDAFDRYYRTLCELSQATNA